MEIEVGEIRIAKTEEGRKERRKGKEKKSKKKRIMKVKKVAEEWEIWNKKEEAVKLKEEAKILISSRFYK